MDQDLLKKIEENQKLIRENLDIARQNQKKIKKIQSHIRRSMWSKIVYWVIIISVTVGALYYSKPYIKEAVGTYNGIKENLDNTSQIINNPGNLFKDVDLIQSIFGS